MTATKQIDEWIAKYGNERDALNVAIAKLEASQANYEILHKQLEDNCVTKFKLLWALEELVHVIGDYFMIGTGLGCAFCGEFNRHDDTCCFDNASAAIAKANGEQ